MNRAALLPAGFYPFLDGRVVLHHGDCAVVIRTLPDNSIDAVVTDPPYELGFMGKGWDATGVANNPALWSEALRVLKPGGHCVAFAATRCGHRMAVAMEDAGFEVRDTLAWVFGTGFPKSLNVSEKLRGSLPADIQCACAPDCQQTAQDSPARYSSYNDRDGEQPLSDLDSVRSSLPSPNDVQEHNPSAPGGVRVEEGQCSRLPSSAHHSTGHSILDASPLIRDSQVFDSVRFDISSSTLSGELKVEHKNPSRTLSKERLVGGSGVSSQSVSRDKYPDIPRCDRCGKLRIVKGLGSALKPAWEMIYLCRKPLSEPTIAANVLRWGTGAINVDGCRVEGKPADRGLATGLASTKFFTDGEAKVIEKRSHDLGRFPANLCHDGSQEVLDLFPESKSTAGLRGEHADMRGDNYNRSNGARLEGSNSVRGHTDSGSAARFFYCAKASKADRAGSKHPTVKPIKLMQWLCRMVTPPNGVVLDLFAGSGTTGEAAQLENFKAILIEYETEYVNHIISRML